MAEAIQDFPENLIPQSMNVNLVFNNRINESSFTQSATTHDFMGAQWKLTLSYSNLDVYGMNVDMTDLQVFIWGLKGMNGRFRTRIFTKKGRVAQGTPKVLGDNQGGTLLQTDGWKGGICVLKKGEMFEVNEELKIITEDIWSNSNGSALLKFVPPLRRVPANNIEIETEKPTGIFRLVDDDQGDFSISPNSGSVTIECVEAFYEVDYA